MMNEYENKKKILFLSSIQYGYFIDHYYASYELSKFCDVDVLCMNCHRSEIERKGNVRVIELPNASKFKRGLVFREYLMSCNDYSYDLVIATYFKGISICAKQINRISKKSYYDVRTVDVSDRTYVRFLANVLINIEHYFFKNCSAISHKIADYLYLPKNRVIIPLGCNIIESLDKKRKDQINLLYVGTFVGRNIDVTIEALSLIPKTILDKINYNIVGDGSETDLQKIKKKIDLYSLSDYVHLHGFIPSDRLFSIYEESHIGISYVPINKIYNYQPPTKTLDYLAAGLPVIATKTAANTEIVISDCGVLVNDDANSFAVGLCELISKIDTYKSEDIKKSISNNTWNSVARVIYNLITN